MQKILIVVAGVALVSLIALVVIDLRQEARWAASPSPAATTTEKDWICTMEAKVCPDGSAVGRSGPNCEFAACPSMEAREDTVTTHMGGEASRFNLTVNPRALVSDSRCAEGVTCIWAGTVEVKTAVSTPTGHGEHIFQLGEPRRVGNFMVTLTEVSPLPVAGQAILESSYRFTYKIERR